MSVFLDNIWIWCVFSFIVGCCCFAWYTTNQKFYSLVITILLPVLILALGLTLYFGIDTDRKAIQRTLDFLVAAVERDDFAAVRQVISPKANGLQHFAQERMNFARISRAKYRNLQIEINDAPSPPVANIRFSAVFYWQNKIPIAGFNLDEPVPDHVRLEFELVKTKSHSWLLTDNFQCSLSSIP